MQPSGFGVYLVREYGAVGDGETLDTGAIQAAVDACADQGGGSVYFSAGIYLSGTIHLRSRVTIELSPRALLVGYPGQLGSSGGGDGEFCLFDADGANRICLCGEGCIDGHSPYFPNRTEEQELTDRFNPPGISPTPRYVFIHFKGCRNVSVQGVRLEQFTFGCCHLEGCKEVTIDGVRLENYQGDNKVGFILSDCEDVRIANCKVNCGDDAFVFEEGGQRIEITNCVITTHMAAFRIGSEGRGVFREMIVSNCVMYHHYVAEVKPELSLDDLVYHRDRETGWGPSAFVMDMHHLLEEMLFNDRVIDINGSLSLDRGAYIGWKNDQILPFRPSVISFDPQFYFHNIRARLEEDAQPLAVRECRSRNSFHGAHPCFIENVTLGGVQIFIPAGKPGEDAGSHLPKRSEDGADIGSRVLMAFGMNVRTVSGGLLGNIQVESVAPAQRQAQSCENGPGLELEGLGAQDLQDAAHLPNPGADGLECLSGYWEVVLDEKNPSDPARVAVCLEH